MKFLVLINSRADFPPGWGPEGTRVRIADGFALAKADADVRVVETTELMAQANEATHAGIDAIVIGADDTIVAIVAAALAGGRTVLGVLPMGTHNQFARYLDIPTSLDDAVAVLARGTVRELPLGEVNGHIFINFAAIGLSPATLYNSEPGILSRVIGGALRLMKLSRSRGLRVSARGHTFAHNTNCVIASNNAHQLALFDLRPAPPPDRGLLNIYVARSVRRNGGRFEPMALPEVRVHSAAKRIDVLIDGQRIPMPNPVRVKMSEKTLRVIVPPSG